MQQGLSAGRRTDPIRAAQVVTELDAFITQALKDQDPALPKYAQLHGVLIRAIEQGIVKEGDKLPSEAELTSMSPFSLGTVQKALKSLMDEGIVARKTGVGTIVRHLDQSMKQPLHCRFSTEDGTYLPVYPKLYDRTAVDAEGPWSKVLGPTAEVFRLDRRIQIGDGFAVVTHFYVDAIKFPIFAHRPFAELHTENFKTLMQEEAQVRISRLEHRLSFCNADADVAAQIDVPVGTQILMIKVTARDSFDEAAYYQELFIPPNGLDLAIDSRLYAL